MSTKSSCTAGQASGAPRDERSVRAAAVLLRCLLALLLPRAALYGALSPFGVALAAAADIAVLPVSLAAAAGYLLAGGASPLRYIAAVGVAGGLRWIAGSVPHWRDSAAVPPLTAAAACLVTGMIVQGGRGMDGYGVLLLVAESVVAAGSASAFRVALQKSAARLSGTAEPGAAVRQACVLFTVAAAVMAAATLTVSGFAPGRAAAALLILLCAREGRVHGGCLAGAVVGTATVLAAPEQAALAAALTFGGLLAGLFERFGRAAQTLAFLCGAGVLALTGTDETILLQLLELLTAGAVYLLLPKRAVVRLCRLLPLQREDPAAAGQRQLIALRLEGAAQAVDDISATVAEVSARLSRHGAPDAEAVCRTAAQELCAACPLYALCWEQRAQQTQAAFTEAAQLLREQGGIAVQELSPLFGSHCRQAERLAERLDRGYAACVARQAAWSRLRDIQSAVGGRLSGLGGLLHGAADEARAPHRTDGELSARVSALCEEHGLSVRACVCAFDPAGRLTVQLSLTGDEETAAPLLRGGRAWRELEDICGRALAAPQIIAGGGRVRVTVTERTRYALEQGVAQRCCAGEKLCGDAVRLFPCGSTAVALLSDGMGSGGRAAVDGAMTVGLTARLWQGGFLPDDILPMVNAALLVKCEEESLATLDAAEVDLNTGRLTLYKAGAAPSLLLSGGRVSRLEQSSLPVGILSDVRFSHGRDRLCPGDVLLLISDGALCAGLSPVEELLRALPPDCSMQQLAERVADAAFAAQGEHPDDITAVALRLTENDGTPEG